MFLRRPCLPLAALLTILLAFAAAPAATQAQPTLTFFLSGSTVTADPAQAPCLAGHPPGTAAMTFFILVEADQSGTRLGDTQVYLSYSSTGFGPSVVSSGAITVTRSTLLQHQAFGATDAYAAPILNDNTATTVSIYSEYLFHTAPAQGVEVPTSPEQLLDVCLVIADAAATSELTFNPLMLDQQFQSDNTPANRYTVVLGGLLDILLPVELVALAARLDGSDVLVSWQTASETNNAGFKIQHTSANAETPPDASKAWQTLAFVEGHGTTTAAQSYSYRIENLAVGRHRFRLKQIDFDGTVAYSPDVEVAVELAETYLLSPAYPNPFNPQTTFTLAVQQAQEVEIGVYNLLGQRVALLHRGMLDAQQPHRFTFEAGHLSSGVYMIRAVGERFVAQRQVVFAK